MTVQNSNKLSHVTYISATPFPYGLGVNKEDYYPLKKGRGGKTAYRGAGSTMDRLTHNSTNCKENNTKRGHIAEKRDMPRFYVGVGTDCRRVPFNEARPKSPGFLCAPSPGGVGNRCIGTGLAALPERRHCAKSCY